MYLFAGICVSFGFFNKGCGTHCRFNCVVCEMVILSFELIHRGFLFVSCLSFFIVIVLINEEHNRFNCLLLLLYKIARYFIK
jgi:hypothetical protein